jgi:peptidyl-prolyl cis-trans isomerase SurA
LRLRELNQAIKPYSDKINGLNYSSEKKKEMLFKVREDFLDQLINRKLTDQEIKRSKISVSEKEIDLALERIKTTSLLTDEELRKVLSREGLTIEKYRENLKEQLLRTKLVNLKVRSKIIITEEEINAYYKKNYGKYKGERKYHLRNIVMRIPRFASDADKKKIVERMEKVIERLEEGESFADLARAHSEAPVAASEGGDLGLFKMETLSPQLQDAIKGLQPGEYTSILETDQGYQIFYIQNILETSGKSLEEVLPEIQEKLFNKIINEKYRAWLEELRKKSHIKVIR